MYFSLRSQAWHDAKKEWTQCHVDMMREFSSSSLPGINFLSQIMIMEWKNEKKPEKQQDFFSFLDLSVSLFSSYSLSANDTGLELKAKSNCHNRLWYLNSIHR